MPSKRWAPNNALTQRTQGKAEKTHGEQQPQRFHALHDHLRNSSQLSAKINFSQRNNGFCTTQKQNSSQRNTEFYTAQKRIFHSATQKFAQRKSEFFTAQ